MTTIVTRAGKGSALTWTEGDSNFTNLNTAKLENISEDLTPTLGGNLDVNEKTLTGVKAVQGNIDGITIKNSSGTNLISVGIAGVDYCTVNANMPLGWAPPAELVTAATSPTAPVRAVNAAAV